MRTNTVYPKHQRSVWCLVLRIQQFNRKRYRWSTCRESGQYNVAELSRVRNNNNNNPICKAPQCQKTSVALDRWCRSDTQWQAFYASMNSGTRENRWYLDGELLFLAQCRFTCAKISNCDNFCDVMMYCTWLFGKSFPP